MSREIKFRAWFELQNKIVHHEVLCLSYANGEGFEFAFDESTADVNGQMEGTMNFELMQYTGLRDKNGTEIYEGDIVQSDNGQVGTVTLESTYLACVVRWSVECVRFFDEEYDSFIGDVVRHCKVIGNIYENADMLHTPV